MTCPLCTSPDMPLIATAVPGGPEDAAADICATCVQQLDAPDPDHFRALASTMWSEDPAIQVLAARTLAKISDPWARDLADQLYLDDDTRAWRKTCLIRRITRTAMASHWPMAIPSC